VPTCVGVKEASGNLNQIADIIAGRPEGFAVYSGDDDLTVPMLALGADGLISVAANAVPGPVSEMVRLGMAGDFAGARDLHFTLLDAMRASFLEPNPVPVKAALAAMGMMEPRVRLPLVEMEEGNLSKVLAAYRPFMAAEVGVER
jgi:4-hydroxy-tetrahydrodipicolinate synthase